MLAALAATPSAATSSERAVPATFEEALTELPDPVRVELDKHQLNADALSVYVQDVSAATPLLTWNAAVPRNPASVMKLLTTLVALHELGPAYRFATDFYAVVPPRGGTVDGDLFLKGHGDPFLVTERFWRMLKDLRQRGVSQVTGDLVVDGGFFEHQGGYRGDFDGRPYRAYNVEPDATLINFQATRFRFFPDADEARVRVLADPPMSTLTVDNDMKLVPGRCGWRRRTVRMHVRSTGPRPTVRFWGEFPEGCESFELLRAVADPLPYTFGVFEAMWRQMGGRIDGRGRVGTVPESATRLQRSYSQPLAELIRYMNKHSNNVMTRNLLLALGAETYGAPGTLEKGRRAVEDWLLLHDIDAPELELDNGSGLSRNGRISALNLARVLLASWKSAFMPEFVSSLPLLALDGTLRNRFRDSGMAGQAHLKTGLLDGARTIAGYMRTRSGRRLVVVSLHNAPGVQNGTGTRVQDALIEWLFEQ